MPALVASGVPAWSRGARRPGQRRPSPLHGGRRGPARPPASWVPRDIARLAEADTALAKRFRVVAPDLRGYGRSEKPRGIDAYRTPVLADDIATLIHEFGTER